MTPKLTPQKALSPEDVAARVEAIRRLADDDEAAHCSMDALYREVLEAIANWQPSQGTLQYRALCVEALKTENIDFKRWYA